MIDPFISRGNVAFVKLSCINLLTLEMSSNHILLQSSTNFPRESYEGLSFLDVREISTAFCTRESNILTNLTQFSLLINES